MRRFVFEFVKNMLFTSTALFNFFYWISLSPSSDTIQKWLQLSPPGFRRTEAKLFSRHKTRLWGKCSLLPHSFGSVTCAIGTVYNVLNLNGNSWQCWTRMDGSTAGNNLMYPGPQVVELSCLVKRRLSTYHQVCGRKEISSKPRRQMA